MYKPTITFWTEKKPEEYVGSDIDIILRCNSRLEEGEIENVKNLLQSGLIDCDYEFGEG